ncbi:MAG TPA: nascent polypeptide-associated complex protein [Thermoplasmata archaeon]|nr:nascent polypeptide-associated complex protein [Thermoplasmata archaeon]
MIPGGRVNPRQMKQMMKRLGIEQEDLGEVDEVLIRTSDKEYVFRRVPVSAVTAQGQRIWQIIGEPIVRPRADVAKKPDSALAPVIPEEDVKLVAEKAGVSEDEARKALEDAGGEPAEAIINLMSR